MAAKEGLPCLLPEDSEYRNFITKDFSFLEKIYGVKKQEDVLPSDEESEDNNENEDWESFKAHEEMKMELYRGFEQIGTFDRYDNMSSVTGTNISDIETATITTQFSQISSITEEELQKQYNFGPGNRDYLLVDAHREQILQLVNDNAVLILSGHTGCGKTTQVPQFILEESAYMKEDVNIIVTQPRKIAAKSVAQRVCDERGWAVGGLVGYHVGLDKMNKSADTKLLFVTTGVLKMMLINDQNNANKFTHIILDEVHERDIDTDFVLLFLKKLMLTSKTRFRLILMSATIDEQKFQDYFSEKRGMRLIKAPRLNIGNFSLQTSNKPVRVTYLDKFAVDMSTFSISEPSLNPSAIQACVKAMTKLSDMDKVRNAKSPGAVLIFLPGIHEIDLLNSAIRDMDQDGPPCVIIPLHSSLSLEDDGRIFEQMGPNKRKVILSTNIAESSITVPDIVYLFDFCLTKNVETDPSTGYPQLQLCWASTQQIEQRKGRVGRVAEGHVFRLVPERIAKNFAYEHPPEMCRIPLTKLVLEIKKCKLGSPKEMLAIAMQPPLLEDICKAIVNLKLIGALLPTVEGVETKDDGDITVLGEIVVKLPVDVQLGKLIVFGYIFGKLEDCVIIAAGLNGKAIFSSFFESRLISYMSKLYWADNTASDFNAILLAYKAWESRDHVSKTAEKKFFTAYNLQRKQLLEMKELVKEIKDSLRYMRLEEPENSPQSKFNLDSYLLMDVIIFGAFYPNYFVRLHNMEREKLAHRDLLKNDPLCSVYFKGLPEDHAEFGELYQNQLKEILSMSVQEEKIEKFQFDRNKIIVNFKKEENAAVSQSVVLALKSGRVKKKEMCLKLFDPEKAKHIYSKLKSSASSDSFQGPSIKPMPAPDMTVNNIKFSSINPESPHSFWIEYEEHEERQLYLKNIIDKNIHLCPKISNIRKVAIGDFYLAPFEDYGYYRVKVQLVRARVIKVQVFYIDYGNVSVVPISSLRAIPVELWADLSDHALAVECSLAGIQPNQTRNTKNAWDEEVIQKFQLLMTQGSESGRRFCASVYSDIPGGHGVNGFVLKLSKVTMYDQDGKEVDVGRYLLQNGYAEKTVESFFSQERAKDRLEFSAQNDAMQMHLNNPNRYEEQRGLQFGLGKDIETMPCQLRGPYNPLEADVVSISKDTRHSKAKIEQNSVNSIIIDPSPGALHSTWLTAAHIEIRPDSSDFLLRNTSWLPSKPGVGPICAMMFAPRVQLRVNEKKTNYTGCLLGLGCSASPTATKKGNVYKSLYPQYDMEVDFDCRVGMDEVFLVNGVRHHLSQILSRGPEGIWRLIQKRFLHDTREDIKRIIKILFSKEFAYKEPEISVGTKPFSWHGVGNSGNNFKIFRALEGQRLQSVTSQLSNMRSLANRMEGTDFEIEMYCPACSKSIESTTDLEAHLRSKIHKETMSRVTLDKGI